MNWKEINSISDSSLKQLNEETDGVCVSMTMPIQKETDKRAMNSSRLKNLLKQADERLAILDLDRNEIEVLLAPARDIIDEDRFLDTDSSGLVIYLGPGFSQVYYLPYAPEEMVEVGPYFQIKPLIPLRHDEHFYVLVLSQKQVRLLNASRFTVERLDIADMPQNLNEALRWDDPERELQWHSQTDAGNGGRPAIFHGHGVGTKETHKEELLRYFNLLDQGLEKVLRDEDSPLILAGVDYLLPIFRAASSYQNIFEDEITGNLEHLDDEEIHQRAWMLIRDEFRKIKDKTVSLFRQKRSNDQASSDLAAIVPAAYQGRIETLFVAIDEKIWGRYNLTNDQLDVHSEYRPGDVDLLNVTAIQTLVNSGDVYARQKEDVPELMPLSAVFRF